MLRLGIGIGIGFEQRPGATIPTVVDHLEFSVQPPDATVGEPFGCTVRAMDAGDSVVTGFTGDVTISIASGGTKEVTTFTGFKASALLAAFGPGDGIVISNNEERICLYFDLGTNIAPDIDGVDEYYPMPVGPTDTALQNAGTMATALATFYGFAVDFDGVTPDITVTDGEVGTRIAAANTGACEDDPTIDTEGAGTLSGTLTIPAVAGVAAFTLQLDTAGDFTLLASAASKTVQSASFTVASGTFSPADIADLKFALEPEDISGLSDDADITSWTDPFNGSNTAVPVLTAPKKQTVGGLAVCRFASATQLVTNSFLDSSFDSDCTIIYVAKPTATGLIGLASNDSFNKWIFSNTSAAAIGAGVDFLAGYGFPAGSAAFVYNRGQVVTFRFDGTNMKCNCNGTLRATNSAPGTLDMSGTLTIGSASPAGFPFIGDFRRIYLFSRSLTDGEVAQMVGYIADKDAGFAGVNARILWIGDSQSGTFGGSGTMTYITAVKDHFIADGVPYTDFIGSTASGRTILDATTAAPSEVDPYIESPNLSARDTLVLWIGTNTLSNGTSVATALTQLNTLISGRKAINPNIKVVLVTMLPSTSVDDAAMIAKRLDFNTQSVNNYADYAIDKVVAIHGVAEFQDPTDETYFFDGTHLTDAGKQIVADLTYAQLNPW